MYKELLYNELKRKEWNQYLELIEGSTHYHEWDWIQYLLSFNKTLSHDSFILFDSYSKPLAVCMLAQSESEGKKVLSFGGGLCGTPGFSRMPPSQARKVISFVYSKIREYCNEKKIERVMLMGHPVTAESIKKKSIISENSLIPLKENYMCSFSNTVIIDLNKSEEDLTSNLSQSKRKLIRKAKKAGVVVEIYNKNRNAEKILETTLEMQQQHFISAGRKTRSDETWKKMASSAIEGNGSLFVAYWENKPISYLFCGEYFESAFGWSQVNVEEFERDLSPRHTLEMEAILYYKKSGYSFYEVGELYSRADLFYRPTDKELSIGHFKEQFGGGLFPKAIWYGFCSERERKDYLEKTHNSLIDRLPLQVFESKPL